VTALEQPVMRAERHLPARVARRGGRRNGCA
jgi:hypothetical protein